MKTDRIGLATGVTCPSTYCPASLAGSPASSAFLRDSGLGALLGRDYLASFGLDRCWEELAAATALGREHDVPFELSALWKKKPERGCVTPRPDQLTA